MRHLKFLLVYLAAISFTQSIFAAGVPFPSLQFLIGNWEIEAEPGKGSGHFEFAVDLQGKVLIRRNHVDYPATNASAAIVHDDLLVITQEGVPAALKGSYFDSFGYLGRYTITANGTQATFVSDPYPKFPRYRLTYTGLPDGRLNAKLEVAPAGKPNAFASYLEWVAAKKATP